ncbi:DNA/RNA non-specific endonuclease [Methylobacterium oryzae]|uniref:DNA/RNA non-specific endonuclease n=1 Tax=Methylobacterium oryzae CBMB20 TaxID=693986 RepID=A0A089P0F2_9HYPH|nr:DNA/RNA non-specific endonuclease [Methylobacterium oryzae]AIQ93147.1 DNA/RNA non-specific endonuclease [Methylobacterium oryzae CBMB20]
MSSEVYAVDTDQVAAATARFRDRSADRLAAGDAVARGRYNAVTSSDRLAKRVNRVLAHLAQANPLAAGNGLPDAVRNLVGRTLAPEDIDDELYERVIEANDLLFVEFLDRGRQAARAVGLIATDLDGRRTAFGTGFMVSPDLLMTNHHVLESKELASRSSLRMDFARDGARQSLAVQTFALDPERFFLSNKELDVALVAVGPISDVGVKLAQYGWLPLIPDEGKINIGESVNIVQHPQGQIKQVVVRSSELVDVANTRGETDVDRFLWYRADTKPGSSGSPVFNDQWEVVALHHSGVARTNAKGEMLDVDGRVWRKGDDPMRLDYEANEGIRVSRLVRFLSELPADAGLTAAQLTLLAAAVGRTPAGDGTGSVLPKANAGDLANAAETLPNPQTRAAASTSPQSFIAEPASTPAASSATVRLTVRGSADLVVPVCLEIRIVEDHRKAVNVVDASSEASEAERATGPSLPLSPPPEDPARSDATLLGYRSTFLDVEVPMPRLDNSVQANAARTKDGGIELKYHHYSVLLHGPRRIAFVSAVNVDAEAPAKVARIGPERWRFDDRVSRDVQAGAEVYGDNPLDRGHLTRRQDAAWGADAAEAQLGNDDTFFWTNCSPQHEVFNQSTKAEARKLLLWGNLENHVTKQAKANGGRVSVFNGPVLRRDDRDYRGIKLPRQFWKIVAAVREGGKLGAYAFLLSQEELLLEIDTEAFEPGPFRPWQVKVSMIEHLTGLRFGEAVRAADPLEAEGAERAFERETAVVRLEDLADVVL